MLVIGPSGPLYINFSQVDSGPVPMEADRLAAARSKSAPAVGRLMAAGTLRRDGAGMKGVGKLGEVLAGEKGKVSYDEVAARLEKIIRSGSQRKAITDFVCRELRKIPHYTWVGVYAVDGGDLVLSSWSGPAATQHIRIPIGQGIWGTASSSKEAIFGPDVARDPRYLQCLLNPRSEIVVPILKGGE